MQSKKKCYMRFISQQNNRKEKKRTTLFYQKNDDDIVNEMKTRLRVPGCIERERIQANS